MSPIVAGTICSDIGAQSQQGPQAVERRFQESSAPVSRFGQYRHIAPHIVHRCVGAGSACHSGTTLASPGRSAPCGVSSIFIVLILALNAG
jgi:hypothetical protein